MPTLKEISYNILNIMEGGRGTNSEYYSLRNIQFNVRYYRALLLRRDAEASLIDLQQFEQEFETPLTIVSTSEDNNAIELCDLFNLILKSTLTVPRTVRIKNGYDLSWVGTANRNSIPLSRFYQTRHTEYDRYTSNGRRAYVLNTYLYITNDPGVTAIENNVDSDCFPLSAAVMRGVFEDPLLITGYTENSEYPISSDMIQRITQSLLNGEMKLMVDQPADTELVAVPDAKDGS